MKKYLLYLLFSSYCILMGACNWFEVRKMNDTVTVADNALTVDSTAAKVDSVLVTDTVQTRERLVQDGTRNRDTALLPPTQRVNTGKVQPEDVVRFAQTLVGTPYVYASINPEVGFDCSGFITYVFNHFKIAVPRSSIDFTDVGKTIPVPDAKPGDLILFTGTDSTEKHIGHMGLVVSNSDTLRFIHSTSGKAKGVTVTPLNAYYKKRFVRVARIFPQNDSAPKSLAHVRIRF
jgi:cell wall-associated NlpC family hydrolase